MGAALTWRCVCAWMDAWMSACKLFFPEECWTELTAPPPPPCPLRARQVAPDWAVGMQQEAERPAAAAKKNALKRQGSRGGAGSDRD